MFELIHQFVHFKDDLDTSYMAKGRAVPFHAFLQMTLRVADFFIASKEILDYFTWSQTWMKFTYPEFQGESSRDEY